MLGADITFLVKENRMFNRNLKRIREQRRLTQRELASKINYSQQAIAKWEVGLSYPDIANMHRLCEALDVNLISLLLSTPKELEPYDHWSLEVALYHALDQSLNQENFGVSYKAMSMAEKLNLMKETICFIKMRVEGQLTQIHVTHEIESNPNSNKK